MSGLIKLNSPVQKVIRIAAIMVSVILVSIFLFLAVNHSVWFIVAALVVGSFSYGFIRNFLFAVPSVYYDPAKTSIRLDKGEESYLISEIDRIESEQMAYFRLYSWVRVYVKNDNAYSRSFLFIPRKRLVRDLTGEEILDYLESYR